MRTSQAICFHRTQEKMETDMKLDYILNASPAIQIHVVVAFMALFFGIFMWSQPKGTRRHKLVGRGFVGLMLVTALSAVFIREINNGSFSLIHIFVPITLFASWEAIHYVRKGNIKRHKRAVKGMFFGALLIPGLLSFLPGRTLWMVFFS